MVVAKGRYTESCTRIYMISGSEGESEKCLVVCFKVPPYVYVRIYVQQVCKLSSRFDIYKHKKNFSVVLRDVGMPVCY